MKNLGDIISGLNACRKTHLEIEKSFDGLLKASNPDSKLPSILYKQNQQQYYALLDCLYDFDKVLEKAESLLAPTERRYINHLYKYSRSLLGQIKFFPMLTYTLWQKSLKAPHASVDERSFFEDLEAYLMLRDESAKGWVKLKECSYS